MNACPTRLHFTGNDAANTLIAQNPLALLIGFVLDQQVTVPTAFSGPLKLEQRLGGSTPRRSPAWIRSSSRRPSARSRRSTASPATWRAACRSSARRSSASTAATRRASGRTRRTTDDLRQRIASLPGFGEMKIKSLGAVLAKRFGVEGGAGPRPEPSDARRRRLARGARALPGAEARAQGEDARGGSLARGARSRAAARDREGRDPGRTLTRRRPDAARDRAAARVVRRARRADARHRDLRRQPERRDGGARPRHAARGRRARRHACGCSTTSTAGRPARSAPPPPKTRPEEIEALPIATCAVPGWPDLMHHKYVVRDARVGVDGLDELDRRLVVARGERDRRGRLARRSRRVTRRTSSSSGRRSACGARARSRPQLPTASARGSRRSGRRSSRTGSRTPSTRPSGGCGSRRRSSRPG